jgi:hypothetical protein
MLALVAAAPSAKYTLYDVAPSTAFHSTPTLWLAATAVAVSMASKPLTGRAPAAPAAEPPAALEFPEAPPPETMAEPPFDRAPAAPALAGTPALAAPAAAGLPAVSSPLQPKIGIRPSAQQSARCLRVMVLRSSFPARPA